MYLSALRFVLLFAFISTSASLYLDFTDELPVYLSDDILISKFSKRSVTKDDAVEETTQPQDDHINPKSDATNEREKTNGKDDTRPKRSIQDKKQPEQLDLAESSVVFLPSFRRKAFRRFRRDTEDITNTPKYSETTEKVSITKEAVKSEEHSTVTPEHETQDGQASGLVFLSSFGRKSKRSLAKRDIPNDHKENKQEKKPEIESKEPNDEIEEVGESGLVFLPSFGRRSRRDVTSQNSSPNEETKEKQNSKQTEIEENAQESSLVFLPSFGRRSRRSVTKRDAPFSDTGKNRNNKPKIEPKESNDETEEEQESGLVFLPSFGRRSRRDTSIQEKKTQTTHEEDVAVPNEQSKFESQDGQESGLVFLPSFGRRNRRHVEKRDTVLKDNDSHPKKEKPSQSDEPKETEEEQESGLVFLPSFGRRTRRNTNDQAEDEQKQKTESVTPEKANVKHKNKSDESEDVQESSLVFLPSFGRRNRRDIAGN